MKKLFCFPILLVLISSTSVLYGQSNEVELIDYYGSGFKMKDVLDCLPFREKEAVAFLDDDKAYTTEITKIESCLLMIPGVRQAEVSFVCCTQPDNQWMVYVGMDTMAAPVKANIKTADIWLPETLTAKYDLLNTLLIEAIEKQEADEDVSNGHVLTKYAPAQKIQKDFVAYANANLKLLQSVLRTSKYPGEREIAATVMAYHTNKKEIINDLLDAISDPETNVRNNAIRAVGVIAGYAQNKPELNIKVTAQPFIALMNSISWADRNKSSLVLLTLTQSRNPEVIRELKSKALKSIIDMAGWRNFGHSLPGYILLGRIVGWSEEVVMSGVNNERKGQLEEMLKAIK